MSEEKNYTEHVNIEKNYIGQEIIPNYVVVKQLKGGGMSKVFCVQDKTLYKLWCLKAVRKECKSTKDEIEKASLLSEANIMRRLTYPNIPRIAQIIDTPESPYIFILMDWVEGTSLQSIITMMKVPTEIVIEWSLQLCSVLNYLHKAHILYRDLKPSNVMINTENNVCLLDFGISVLVNDQNRTIKNALGTRGFAAPELYAKGAAYDFRSDIYALGATMFYMLTGMSPASEHLNKKSKALKASEFNTAVPFEIDAIIQKAMEDNPDDRFQSMGEMAIAIKECVEKVPEHRKRLKQKAITIGACFGMSIACALLSFIPKSIYDSRQDAQYLELVKKADFTGDSSDYLAAINKKPQRIEPYLGYVESLKADGQFTPAEETGLRDTVLTNLDILNTQEQFGELAFKVGELYWYYYTDANGQLQSKRWFEYAKAAGYEPDMANVYFQIADFQTTLRSNLGSEQPETVKQYWDNLMKAKSFAKVEELQLQVLNSIAECIYTKSYLLYNAGVEKAEVEAEVKNIKATIKALEGSQRIRAQGEELFNTLKAQAANLDEKVEITWKE